MKRQRRFKRYSSLIILGLTLSLSTLLSAVVTYPKPTQYKYLNDYAGVVDTNNAQQIIALGRELEQKTGAQAVIVTIKSLEGNPIEDYANNLFRRWGIGQSSKDNGLLILLSVEDKQWRVEVGRGLEGAIPDALSNRIMQELGRDEFVQGFYGQGLAQTYSQFCDQIAIEYDVTLTHSLHTSLPLNTAQNTRSPIAYFLILGLFLFDILFNRGRLLRIFFWSSFFSRDRNNRGGGNGYGGFGGGSSNGGGSSGSW